MFMVPCIMNPYYNIQQDATVGSQYFISLQYYSTCFGCSYNHHQEYKKLQSQPLVWSYIPVS
jgi:hypothetical protein